ncbi:MAG: Flp pilus assembly complex ATPase component TadA [Verrucomicrobia bacterium]|nr:Flp pilus assembly complex ATPase component TadA [Verrucomicrobiota bacterium]MCG2679988.1 Flp pilus assembly complex ATPase component TadA [Kiritimatiellia bacterium]MBU4247373.1 Flp pilus assembly complex ATPase component TadA [Verrucomicrobiota bacterium]MBU4290622.1 Flp pilus assembly complex ATPase component TadA [Verrucomicrobiota bacterium]MBU4429217.1 Flp pilus assembly complex ATPase component TadA [Verrucomicrobiota bacterium]
MAPDVLTPGPAGDPHDLDVLGRKFRLDVVTSVTEEMLDPELVANLPVEWARSHAMLPVHFRSQIAVLTAQPDDLSGQKHLELLLGRELLPVLASRETITSAIERCYFSRQETPLEFLRDMDPLAATVIVESRSDDLLQVAENAPVTQLINLILLEAVKGGASDVHVEPFESRLRVRYRIDGQLYEQASPPKHLEPALISRLKVMAHMDISEKRLPQDGVARVRIGEREIDIRVSTIPVAEGERVVLRLLNRNTALLPLSGLGLSDAMLASLGSILQESHGVFLVCGPTGSGKTTTLYAALQRLNKDRTNILTIEDPIEYQLPDIGQIQVKPKIGLTFAAGLRHILRQDPDTILVGEIRDLETAEIAIRASLTGHLVFSTLHTNDAPSAVIRLIDMGIEPYLLAASLRAIMAQRLVRCLCPVCRERVPAENPAPVLPAAVKEKIGKKPIWQARGCPACLDGYHGRTGLFELMMVDAEMAEAIRTASSDSRRIYELAVRRGMITLLDDGLVKLADGVTSLAEIMRTLGKFG